MSGFSALNPSTMAQLFGGDRKRTVRFVDNDGDGEPDQKIVEVRVDGKLKRQKIKQL